MEDVSGTLESLIHRATNPRNPVPHTSAITEVCHILNREPYCAHVAARLIATKIQSPQEQEALQGLTLLDSCMKHCGVSFHAEVGKFRFLNEMIKLVSPKYLGARTPLAVRQRVLQLMYAWTQEYPRETKIREAYDMLKKQGVIKDEPVYVSTQLEAPIIPPPRRKNSIFEDEERSRLLQKLLQSKNPDDLQAANRLIKTMVKEDEQRLELNSRRITELESVHNNARLLSEMLDSYRSLQTSAEEMELIKELRLSCERLRPNVFRLASETQDNELLLNEVLRAGDELGQVLEKYHTVIVQGRVPQAQVPQTAAVSTRTTSLLDLSTPSEERLPPVPVALLDSQLANLGLDIHSESANIVPKENQRSHLESLGDIFGALASSEKSVPVSTVIHPILQPVTVSKTNTKREMISAVSIPEKPSKLKAFEDLDALGESLLKQNLPKIGSQFSKPIAKVPMNLLSKSPPSSASHSAADSSSLQVDASSNGQTKGTPSLDLDFLIGGSVKVTGKSRSSSNSELLNGDDSMVDLSEDTEGDSLGLSSTIGEISRLSEDSSLGVASVNNRLATAPIVQSVTEDSRETRTSGDGDREGSGASETKNQKVKSLGDICVSLDSIKPGLIPPLPVLEEKNGITVILHFAKDTPRPDVSVVVVTTLSKNTLPLTNYLFQAVVPKTCKLRLQSPSGSELPAHSPFLPPSAITQVMLIANPSKDPVSLKFMISYTMDEETITEMGEVERLPLST